MTTPRRRLIAQRREQLGIGIAEIARRIGVSVSEYRDVELYEDELTMVLALNNARSLAAILGFEIGTLLGAGSLAESPSANNKPRHTVLAEARARLGVSTNEMAEAIGFDEAFVHRIENDDRALETYPYDVLRIVADYLSLDPRSLLCAPCA
jgi:transcriptional regulator with XRE-family HTH domain